MPHTPGGTEVASVDLGTLWRHHGLWVWLTTCARGLADPLGRFCDTMRGARGLLSGSWDASAIPCDGCARLLRAGSGWVADGGRLWDAPAKPGSV